MAEASLLLGKQRSEDKFRLSQWLFVGLFSMAFHASAVFWFSSMTPNFPHFEDEQFKVSLLSSGGPSETLQASRDDLTKTQAILPAEMLKPLEASQTQAAEAMIETVELIPATSQQMDRTVETIKPVEPDSHQAVASANLTAPVDLDEQTLIELEEVKQISIIEEPQDATGVTADLASTVQLDDFFKPAEVRISDQANNVLPIEQLSAVPAPVAIAADNNPTLAAVDVEILEIKARELMPATKPNLRVEKHSKPLSQGVNTGLEPGLAEVQSGHASAQTASQAAGQLTIQKTDAELSQGYILELKTWLSQFKRYPLEARQNKLQGVVIISLQIDHDGQVRQHKIVRSSGHQLLDQEVEMMIKRAQKMPMLPATFQQKTLELLIPIRFKQRS